MRLRSFFFGLALAQLILGASAAQPAASLAEFEGTWLGEVIAPNARAEIGLAFKSNAQGGLNVSFFMPVMHAYGLELGPADISGGVFTLPPLDTKLALAADKLTGTFALPRLPAELRRGGAFAPEPPPPVYPAGPRPRWSLALGAQAWASPVIQDDIIYVGTVDGKFHARRMADGAELWTWSGPHPLYGTALASENAVYFVDAQMELTRLDRQRGAQDWRVPLHDEKLTGEPVPKNPTFNRRTVTPALIDGTLYVGSTDGGIYALDPATGRILWRHEAKTKIFAAPSQLPGGHLLFGGFDGSVLILDPVKRVETARLKLGGPVVSTPMIVGDTVIVGSRDYQLYGIDVTRGEIVWRDSFWFSWVESTPAVRDGVAYVGSSDFRRVTAVEPTTGCYAWSTDVRGLTWGTPVVTADTVYTGTSAQNPAYLKHDGGIVALERKSGAMKWRIAFPLEPSAERAGIIGSLALAGDTLIAVAFDGTLIAYPVN